MIFYTHKISSDLFPKHNNRANNAAHKQGANTGNDRDLDGVHIRGDLFVRFVFGFVDLVSQLALGLLPRLRLCIDLIVGIIDLCFNVADTLCNDLNGCSDTVNRLLVVLDFLQLKLDIIDSVRVGF